MTPNNQEERLRQAANEFADKYGFQVPYDGTNNFYDDVKVKSSLDGFIAGAHWQQSQGVKKEEVKSAEETKTKDEILLENGFDILENGCCYTEISRIERAMESYASQFKSGEQGDGIEFAEWIEDNYVRVDSSELKRWAWINYHENEVLRHGSDYHFTNLINKCGKTTQQLYQLFLTNKKEKK